MITSTRGCKLVALSAALLLLSGLPGPPAAADDRSLVKESESEPYVMILLDTTGSMNRIPSAEQYPDLRQDDEDSRLYQAKEALYQVLSDERVDNIHFGFATFPNQDNLRVRTKRCDPGTSDDNLDCIAGNEGDVCIDESSCGGFNRTTTSACFGWEPNEPSATDDHHGFNLLRPTVNNPNDSGYPDVLKYGDIIPMDWDSEADRAAGYSSDNRLVIQKRLAPKDRANGTPDFRVNSYFSDTRIRLPISGCGSANCSGTSANDCCIYPLRNTNQRPLIGNGLTPLARTLNDFRLHFESWKPVAQENDPQFGCKQVHVILITDGLDTCEASGDQASAPVAAATALYNNGMGPQVWVIGYSTGIGSTGRDVINDIAEAGGTFSCPIVNNCVEGAPGCCDGTGVDHAFFPTTKEDLVEAIAGIGSKIRGDARSFAAAAVPQGQANFSDKIYLASFFPLQNLPLWPGALDAYLRPLPLRTITVPLPDGTTEFRSVPDRGEVCDEDDRSRCRLWDAGEELLLQGADDMEIAGLNYNLGPEEDQRRVYYSVPQAIATAVPAVRRPFVPPGLGEEDDQAAELMNLMGCNTIDSPFLDCDPSNPGLPSDDPPVPSNMTVLHQIVSWLHQTKEYQVPAPDPDPSDGFSPGSDKPYLLGEIFHSDPVVIGSPENFRYYVDDLFADRDTRDLLSDGFDEACGDREDGEGENEGYICFFEKHRYRRKLVISGSNDGQLHVFDGGSFVGGPNPGTGLVGGGFTEGTGRELFSFIPRNLMPMLAKQAQGAIELYGVDGKVQAADVAIDIGAGREWRTVVVGGLREGGTGYYALDVTQPDKLPNLSEDDNVPVSRLDGTSYVPSCLDGGGDCSGPYPQVLWEFNDPDLAESWSRPALGVVEVCAVDPGDEPCPAESEQFRFVAVFGGGIQPDQVSEEFDPTLLTEGRHLYIVDIETGQAIYKRQLDGAVPSEPAAVDTDQDGVLDTIYVGTTSGTMYKVSLTGKPPLTAGRVAAGDWDPFPLFQVNTGGEDNDAVRPIFYPPSVVFLADRGRYALAFGTGYREDLWRTVNQNARFVVVLDEFRDLVATPAQIRPFELGDYLAGDLPLDVDDLIEVDPEASVLSNDNLLIGTGRGWWMELQPEERLIATPFALSGLLVFLTFQPDEVVSGGGLFCANAGIGRSFSVQTVNGTTIRTNTKAYTVIPDLPTSPFTEVGVTKNPSPEGQGDTEAIPEPLLETLEALKRLFPRECRFSNYTINVKARRSDTGIQWIAPVPVCIVQKNWKVF